MEIQKFLSSTKIRDLEVKTGDQGVSNLSSRRVNTEPDLMKLISPSGAGNGGKLFLGGSGKRQVSISDQVEVRKFDKNKENIEKKSGFVLLKDMEENQEARKKFKIAYKKSDPTGNWRQAWNNEMEKEKNKGMVEKLRPKTPTMEFPKISKLGGESSGEKKSILKNPLAKLPNPDYFDLSGTGMQNKSLGQGKRQNQLQLQPKKLPSFSLDSTRINQAGNKLLPPLTDPKIESHPSSLQNPLKGANDLLPLNKVASLEEMKKSFLLEKSFLSEKSEDPALDQQSAQTDKPYVSPTRKNVIRGSGRPQRGFLEHRIATLSSTKKLVPQFELSKFASSKKPTIEELRNMVNFERKE